MQEMGTPSQHTVRAVGLGQMKQARLQQSCCGVGFVPSGGAQLEELGSTRAEG
jgi:hypothetical protein